MNKTIIIKPPLPLFVCFLDHCLKSGVKDTQFWKQAACIFCGCLAFLTPPNLFWSGKVFVGGYKQRAIYTFPESTKVLKIIY